MAQLTAAFPSVIAALVTVATDAVPTARVVRGRDISDEPGDVVIIGQQEIDVPGAAGTFQQTMQTFGGNREELGTVNGLVVAWNGDSDADAACTTAFGYLALLEAAIRDDNTLGLTAFDYIVAELQAGDVSEPPNDHGAITAISFAIDYKVRI